DPAVREAVVVARPSGGDSHGGDQLVGYVVATDRAVDGLLERLRARLPEYLVPAHLVPLDRLPLTASGKVDRRALPGPRGGRAAYTAPGPGLEEQVASVWQEVLGVDRIGRDDNFFALGGHSLL